MVLGVRFRRLTKGSRIRTLGRIASPMLAILLVAQFETDAYAHPGRTAADGCHNDRKNGGRHCHGGNSASSTKSAPAIDRAYRNCAEARAAGVTPLRRGQPGYGSHLDRDNDGIACE